MKKFLYSFVIFISFGLYALYQQNGAAESPAVPTPTSQTLPPTAVNPGQQPSPAVLPQVETPPPAQKPSSPATPSTPTPAPTPAPAPKPKGQYNDGQYTGPAADAYYGNIQVRVTISGGKITDVIFLQHPSDRSTSIRINSYAMPLLTQEAIQAQSANVDIVSGATDSSMAFQQSLAGSLAQAKS